MKTIVTLVLFFVLTLSASNDRGLMLKKMQTEQRVALVIGNNNYENLSDLKNPINDARLMKKSLQQRGFKVIYKEDATKREMKKLVKNFSSKLNRGGIGLYYFAGHGVNVSGKNYLVGTNSLMEDKDEVEYETLALNFVTTKMKNAGNRLNIIILDACRNDPFSRSGGGGLAPVSNAKGIFIAYATEAGSVASDGKNGKNGIFTKHLVKNLQEEGATIERVFKNTRADVYDATKGKQSPGVYNQIRGDFFFTLPKEHSKTTKDVKPQTYKEKYNKPEEKSFKEQTQALVQRVKEKAEALKRSKKKNDFRCKIENVLAPKWVCTQTKQKDMFSAVGIAKKSKVGVRFTRRVAIMNARSNLAQKIKHQISRKTKDKRVLKKLNKVNLASSKATDVWFAPSGTIYMLVSMSKADVYKALR